MKKVDSDRGVGPGTQKRLNSPKDLRFSIWVDIKSALSFFAGAKEVNNGSLDDIAVLQGCMSLKRFKADDKAVVPI